MKLIYKIETNAKLNKKAADLSAMLGLYRGCLFVFDEAYRQFVKDLRSVIENINKHYSRTRPFEIYSELKTSIYIYACRATASNMWREFISQRWKVYLSMRKARFGLLIA